MMDCSPLFAADYDEKADVTLYWFQEQVQQSGFDPADVPPFHDVHPWQSWQITPVLQAMIDDLVSGCRLRGESGDVVESAPQ